jgi:general secretion pathway protein F
MQYRYEAISIEGATVVGNVDADSQVAVVKKLALQQLTAVEVKETNALNRSDRKKNSSTQERLIALHELATLLESGVGIADAIESQSCANYAVDLHQAFTTIGRELKRGASFSESLRESGLTLPEYVHQLVQAGEVTGKLGASLRNAVNQMEYDQKLAGEFKSALIYPSILVVSGIAAVMLVFVFVVPKFASLVEKNDDLPLLAEIVLKGGIWFNEYSWWLGGSIGLFFVLAARLFREKSVRQKALDFMSGLPLLGVWIGETDTAKWSAIMAALLTSKVELLAALELARIGVSTSARREKHGRVISSIRGGKSLADSLEEAQVLTPTGYNLVRVGEKAGKLPEMMKSLAKLYDESSRNRMQTVLALIEPIAILTIGSVIGVIILGVILAITSVNDVAF